MTVRRDAGRPARSIATAERFEQERERRGMRQCDNRDAQKEEREHSSILGDGGEMITWWSLVPASAYRSALQDRR